MTLGSLFDGSGTCPLAAALCGITPIWASEIEPYPIRVTDYTALVVGNGQLNQMSMSDKAGALNCMHDQQAVLLKRLWHYIVCRLTPLECCRLQGFPDWWEDGVGGSDSARYKMWGNGMALPCVLYVMEGITDGVS